MLRIHLFSIFTIKMSRVIAALAPLGHLMVKTLTSVHFFYINYELLQIRY